MKVAIVGPPQSGKSTLLGAVTGVPPNPIGLPQLYHSVVKVPDPRLTKLAEMYKPKKITEATIEYIDVPGFSLADQKGQDDLKRFLPDIRQCELLVIVVRDFQNDSVPAYRNRIDAQADLTEFRDELIYGDLAIIENRIEKLDKALKKPTKSHELEKREHALLVSCREVLEESKPLLDVITNEDDRKTVAGFQFLTLKPVLVVYNVSEDRAGDPHPEAPADIAGAIGLCAVTELEIAQLDPDDRSEFLADYGLTVPASDRLMQKSYEALGLISFLTAGEPEVRAWSLRANSDAVEAARQIHSDIARGFIRAETVAYDDLIAAGDMKAAKAAGKVRQEGKTYIIQDGDVILFKFNV